MKVPKPFGTMLCGYALLANLAAPGAVDAQPRSEELPPVPWSARATTTVVREEKTFRSGGTELRGTLILPKQSSPIGAVVVAHGASSPLRTSPLYRHLVEMLPALGIAVFIYDRRGSGELGGLRGEDFDVLADDVGAAVRMLGGDARLDPHRIGVWGLSQGGWLSLLAASKHPEIAFSVAVSAPLVTPDVQMMFSSTNSLIVNGYTRADIDFMTRTRKAVDDYERGTESRENAQRLLDAAKDKPWFKYLYMGANVEERTTSSWRREIAHDPAKSIVGLGVPALIIYGAADPVVPVAISVDRLSPMDANNPNIHVVVVAGADHGMQTSVDPKTLLDPSHADDERPDAPEYFAVLSKWLTDRHIAGAADSPHPSPRR